MWPVGPDRNEGHVKTNALKGRTFASLDEQNRFLQEWERTVADTRIHGTTKLTAFTCHSHMNRESIPPGRSTEPSHRRLPHNGSLRRILCPIPRLGGVAAADQPHRISPSPG